MGEPLNVAMVGCGNIAAQYLASLSRLSGLRLVAVVDAVPAAAERISAETGVTARTVAEVLADDEVDAVLNLTPPQVHAPLSISALEAGKHVYLEKPIATSLGDADAMLRAAAVSGRRLGSAPDTVLGTGIQTARQLVDSGAVGRPVAATAFMMSPGHESWHPNAGFYYQHGAGPLLDMGVYYLTALVTLLGPIEGVSAMGSRVRSQRVVPGGAPRAGEVIEPEVDTHVSAVLRHESGVLSTLVVSFDAPASRLPRIELYGTEGALDVPDPNRFDEPVGISKELRGTSFAPVPVSAGYRGAGRGYGMADMARAIHRDEPHRQSAELGYHVNEVMERTLESIRERREVAVRSRCQRPAPVPLDATPDLA